MRFSSAAWTVSLIFCAGGAAVSAVSSSAATATKEIALPRGLYEPVFKDKGEKSTLVGPLWMDQTAVTNDQFLSFIKKHPEFSKSRIKPLFADEAYLSPWSGDGVFESGKGREPVTSVSWFVARRYCASLGKRLPSIAEWEFASDAENPENEQKILKWYSTPKTILKEVNLTQANKFGLKGMHEQIWEWVEDFSQVMMPSDSRDTSAKASFFCAGAALKVKDPKRYAAFLRFAFRSGLSGRYTSKNLGFRCVRDKKGSGS